MWEQLGYYRGRTVQPKPAWNKGLTKATDERVEKYTNSRNKHFENGESIGCFGVRNNDYGFKKGDSPWNKGYKMSTHELSLKFKEENK